MIVLWVIACFAMLQGIFAIAAEEMRSFCFR